MAIHFDFKAYTVYTLSADDWSKEMSKDEVTPRQIRAHRPLPSHKAIPLTWTSDPSQFEPVCLCVLAALRSPLTLRHTGHCTWWGQRKRGKVNEEGCAGAGMYEFTQAKSIWKHKGSQQQQSGSPEQAQSRGWNSHFSHYIQHSPQHSSAEHSQTYKMFKPALFFLFCFKTSL